MPTAHIGAAPGAFAADVIMPGDPLRARRIAEDWFNDPELVTDIRGILGYTGTYHGRPISVLASGMGMPSATIYATELVREYEVKRIVRVGTAGGIAPRARLRDIVIASGAHTDSAMTANRIPGIHFSHVASFELLERAAAAARRLQLEEDSDVHIHIGTVFSTDAFYLSRPAIDAALVAHDVLAVEMEAAALYAVAAAERCQALAIMTISDRIGTAEEMSALEREQNFVRALTIGLTALA